MTEVRRLSGEQPSDEDLQRSDGCSRLVVRGSARGTLIEDVFQRSPMRIMFPRTLSGEVREAVLLNTAGGVAGGDRLACEVTVTDGASLAVTSQAAEKVYRALSEPARIATRLAARGGARLAWLPQETIVFDQARLRRQTDIEVSPDAELLALEWLVLGRAARGEKLVAGEITESWRVKRDGRLIWADTFRATDETFPSLRKSALLGGRQALATLLYSGSRLDAWLEVARELASSRACDCAATAVSGLLIVRFASTLPSCLRLALRFLLQRLGHDPTLHPFRVPKMWSC